MGLSDGSDEGEAVGKLDVDGFNDIDGDVDGKMVGVKDGLIDVEGDIDGDTVIEGNMVGDRDGCKINSDGIGAAVHVPRECF